MLEIDVMLTGNTGAKSDKHHSSDWIFDTESASKIWCDISDDSRDQADTKYTDKEAQVAPCDI